MKTKLFIFACLLGGCLPSTSHAATCEVVAEQVAVNAETSMTIHVEQAGTLSTIVTADELKLLEELKITGSINSSDVNYIKESLSSSTLLISLDFGEASYVATKNNSTWSFKISSIKSIVLPFGITALDTRAFYHCNYIEQVSIPESVTKIGKEAFSGCNRLVSVNIPNSVTDIDTDAFNNVHPLLRVYFQSAESMCRINYANEKANPASLSHHIFIGESKEEVRDLVLPSSVETVNNYAIRNIEIVEFSSAKVPETIGANAFSGQTIIVVPPEAYEDYCAHPNLQNQVRLGHIITNRSLLFQTIDVNAMPDNSTILDTMGEYNMSQVYNLTLKGSINGYDVVMIRNKMPNLMHLDMTEVEIVANPYEYYQGCHTEDHRLGVSMFRYMENLRSIKLPQSITCIDAYAFNGCSNLRECIIHSGVTEIGERAFYETGLESISIPESVKGIHDNAFSFCESLENVIFGEGLLNLGNNTFSYDSSLKTVTLPSTIEVLTNAFSRCYSLESIRLPDHLKEISSSALNNTALREIYIPADVTSIGYNAFGDCASLESVRIPPMVETIGDGAFSGTGLRHIYVYLANPKDIEIKHNTFTGAWKTATLHVPSFSFYEYYLHPMWGQFFNIVKFDEDYQSFYTKNTVIIDRTTGIIEGTPDAKFYENGSLIVNDREEQSLGEVTLTHKGRNSSSLIPEDTGNITIETLSVDIKVSANNWHFFCFPFDIDLSSVSYDGEYVWRQYDGERRSRREGGWQNISEGMTTLQAKRGYIFWGTKAGVLHLQVSHPTIIGDDVSEELKTYNSADTDPADANWNFIGNPYTSYYAVDEDTYNAPITVWTGKGYEAYRPGDDDYEFAPYEAFFVQTPASSNTINFNADNREGYEQAQETQSNRRMARAQKKVNPNRLLVNLELGVQGEEEYLDKTRVVFNDACSLDYESDCDAAKFFSEERRAEFYTIGADGTQYAINERPEEGGYVNLGFVANQKGKYSISAQRIDVPMLLVDDVMETTFDLRNGAYEFSSAKGTFNKRFSLKRYEGITTSIKDLADQIGMTFCISDGTISFEGLDDATRVCLYNMAGQQIATQQGNGTFTALSGTYIISVGKLTAKVLL